MSYEEVSGDLATLLSTPFVAPLKWLGWWGSDDWNFATRLPDVNATFAEEGSPIPLFFGRVRLRNPNVTWYGNLIGEDYDEDAYYYEMNVMMVFGIPMGTDHNQNPGTVVRRVWWDDAKVWPYPQSDDSVGNWTTGTQAFGKGMEPVSSAGDVNFHGGSFEQSVDLTMQTHFTAAAGLDEDLLPNYRGIAYAYFHGNNNTYPFGDTYRWGNSTDLPQMSWELEAITHPLSMSDINSEGDANPAEVIYDLLTNPWGKLGLSTSLIDTTSFTSAATTLHSEGNGISLIVDSNVSIKSVIEGVLRQIDGVMYVEPSTGKLCLKLIREDYTVGNLVSFTKANVVKVEGFSTTMWEGNYNEIRLNFTDRSAEYATRPAYAHDHASIVNNGKKSLEISYPGVCTATLANKIAARELQAYGLPRAAVQLRVNRDAVELRPGDVIRWSDEDYGITDMVLRIHEIDFGEFEDNSILLTCSRDKFDTSHEVFAQTPEVVDPPTSEPDDVTVWDAIECPAWFNQVAGLSVTSARWAYFAKQPSTDTLSFNARRTRIGDSSYNVDKTGCPFSGYAEIETYRSQYAGGEVDETYGITVENPTTGLIAAIESATDAEMQYDTKNYVLVDDEIMAFEDITDNGDSTYTLKPLWRGMLDTVPEEHAVGARVWFFQADISDLFDRMGNLTESIGSIPVALSARLLGVGGAGGELGFGSSAGMYGEAQEIALEGRAASPLPPDEFAADQSYAIPAAYNSYDQNNETTEEVTWKRRKRYQSSAYKPDDADDPETGVTYSIQLYTPEDGWVTAASGIDDTKKLVSFQGVSYGLLSTDSKMRIVATDGSLNSIQKPWVDGGIYMYRNLLVNGGFEDGTLRGWTTETGSPTIAAGGKRGSGYHATYTDDWSISQKVDIEAFSPVGFTARLRVYFLSSDITDTCTVTLEPLKSDDSSAGTAATSGAVSPDGAGDWKYIDVAFTDLPADTAKLEVTISINEVSVGAHSYVSGCDLRLGAMLSAQLLSNPGFETGDTTNWTETGTWNVNTDNSFEGDYLIEGDGYGETITQTVSMPTGYEYGPGYAWLHADGTAGSKVRLQVLASNGTTVVADTTTRTLAASSIDIFVKFPYGSYVKAFGYAPAAGDPEAGPWFELDNFRVHVFKTSWPEEESILDFTEPNAQTFPDDVFGWDDFGTDPPTAIWLMEDDNSTGQFTDQLSDKDTATSLWLDIVSDTNHAYQQEVCGFYNASTGYVGKTGLETRDGSNVGLDFPNTGDASMDGTNSFALLGVFSAKRNGSDRYLAGSGTTVGWNLKLKSTGVLELYVGSSGDSDTITLTEDYRDGAHHYFVVWYDGTADTFRLWTDQESPSATAMPTGDCSNATYARIGGVATQTSPAAQWSYAALWRTANAESLTPTMTGSWWVHGTDMTPVGGAVPGQAIESHNLNVPITVPVRYNSDGDLAMTYGPGQIPLAYLASADRTGIVFNEAQTNLLSDTDPNSSNWVEEGSPTVTGLYGPDAQRWKRSVKIVSDNSDAYRPPAITQGSGDITVAWYAKHAAEEAARLTLVQTDGSNPINHDYVPATADVGKWKRYEHTFAWAGGTAAFELWFHGSDDATARTIEISGPILVVAGDEVQLAITHSTTALSASQVVLGENQLDPNDLRQHGEINMKAAFKYDVGPGTEQHLINMNGGNNIDRRVLLRDASDDLDFYHYDGAGTPVLATGTVTSPSNWDKEFTVRARWNYGGIIEDTSVYAELDGFFSPYSSHSEDDARTSAWTLGSSGTYNTISIGGNSGSNVMNGIITELTLSNRERTKA